jgi:predicted GIY-YIG superfamily endonuclease
MYWVYRVEVLGTTRYIGYTDDLTRREKQHNYLCFKVGKKKKLYDGIKKSPGIKTIELTPIKTFRTKIEAKRYEAFLILNDYFNKKELWQHIPKITDM